MSAYADPGACFDTGGNCAHRDGAQIYNLPARIYPGVFDAFVQRPSVTSVRAWGLKDGPSCLNSFPITCSNYPLLFDPGRQPKTALLAITDPASAI